MFRILPLILLVSCSQGNAEPEPPPLPVPVRPAEPPREPRLPERDTIVRLHMHENFDLLRAMERLIIRGQLDQAKQFAEAIASAPSERGLGAFEVHATQVRERAAALARAQDVDEGSQRVAELAAACAGCHAASGALLELRSYPAAPSDDATISARMARHRWAADRIWESIIANVDDPWRSGLGVLAATPSWARELGKDRLAHARRLQQQAQTALRMESQLSPDERARVYGELLATCAGCHTARPAP